MTTKQNCIRRPYQRPEIELFAINADCQLLVASPIHGQHKPVNPGGIYDNAKEGTFFDFDEDEKNSENSGW